MTHDRAGFCNHPARWWLPPCVVGMDETCHPRRTGETLRGRLMGIGILTASLMVSAPAHAETRTCPQWEPALAKAGLPVKWASGIMWRESRCMERVVSKPNADGTTDIGLMQINSSWFTVTRAVCKTTNHRKALRRASCNLKVARWLYDHGGKHHWRGTSGK